MGACCSSPAPGEEANADNGGTKNLSADKKAQALQHHHSNSSNHSKNGIKQYQPRNTLSFEPTKSDDCSDRVSPGTSMGTSFTSNPQNLAAPKVEEEQSMESFTPSTEPQPQEHPEFQEQKSEFEMKMEKRRTEQLEKKRRLEELQKNAFDNQVRAMQGRKYRRLYGVFKEYAKDPEGETMDIDGLTSALSVFGMIIDTNSSFQQHIWTKFDLENEMIIRFDDFSATMAYLISYQDDDCLQTMFEIFDIDEDGYLRVEDFARIFLTQNQIAVVCSGSQQDSVYTKKQCLKQARKIMTQCDISTEDGRISFEQFKLMIEHMKKESEMTMMMDHMFSLSHSLSLATEYMDSFTTNRFCIAIVDD